MRNEPLPNHDNPVDHKPDRGKNQQTNGPVYKAAEKSAVKITAGI